MFAVFDCQNVPYLKTWDEVEADTIAAQIGGYYVESGFGPFFFATLAV